MDPSNIQRFPVETQMEILSYLPRDELLNLCQVNNLWKNLCKNELLWKSLYHQDFLQNKLYNDMSWYENYQSVYKLSKSYANNLYHSFLESLENYLAMNRIPMYSIPIYLNNQIVNNLKNVIINFIHLYGDELSNPIRGGRFSQIENYLTINVNRILSYLLKYLDINEKIEEIDLYSPNDKYSIYYIIRDIVSEFFREFLNE